ncbi:MAG: fibronectin type III domain-containing protein [Candidatus Moraniibacteriota bacterium]|nr:MAG: fibronectin type III domain-containing protein [Candidatus Moranbacteria bacterium]
MVQRSSDENGLVSFDYEPSISEGFCPSAVVRFKSEKAVTDSDFSMFQSYIAANGANTYKTTDPKMLGLYNKWVQFRNEQTAEYIARIRSALAVASPQTKMAVTTRNSVSGFPLSVAANGPSASDLARHMDIAMPQIYLVWTTRSVKNVIKFTELWANEIRAAGATTKLWPLLLLRNMGLSSGNPASWLHQQTLAALVSGAQGVIFYHPHNFEASHWNMLSDISEELALFENYYADGVRADASFSVSNMPTTSLTEPVYPGYDSVVTNAYWHFTVHRLGSKYLLTLFNLQESGNLVFPVSTSIPNIAVESMRGTTQTANLSFTVAPNTTAFVVLASPDGQNPTAPSNLVASALAQEVSLSWSPSTDNVGVTGYQIERCVGAGCVNFTPLTSVSTSPFSDTSVAFFTVYRYRVRALDASGNMSSYSNIVEVTSSRASFVACSTVTQNTWSTFPGRNLSYGTPYDVFSPATLLVKAQCTPSDPTTFRVDLGNEGNMTMVFSTKGYYYASGSWVQYTSSCSGVQNGNWCQGYGSATVTDPAISTASASSPVYLVGMTCQVQGGAWKCGCRDTTCSSFYWQVQGAGQ